MFDLYPKTKIYLNQKYNSISESPIDRELVCVVKVSQYWMASRCILMYVSDKFIDIRICSSKPGKKHPRPVWGRMQILHSDIGKTAFFYNDEDSASQTALAKRLSGEVVQYVIDSDAAKVSPVKSTKYLEYEQIPMFNDLPKNICWVNALHKVKTMQPIDAYHDVFATEIEQYDKYGYMHPDFMPWHTAPSYFKMRIRDNDRINYYDLFSTPTKHYDSIFLNYGPLNILSHIDHWKKYLNQNGTIYGINVEYKAMIDKVSTFDTFAVRSENVWSISL